MPLEFIYICVFFWPLTDAVETDFPTSCLRHRSAYWLLLTPLRSPTGKYVVGGFGLRVYKEALKMPAFNTLD